MPTIAGTVIDPKALPPLPGDNNGRLFGSSEWMQLIRSNRAVIGEATGAAGAANASFVQLRNPTGAPSLGGSKVLLYDIFFFVPTTTDVVLKLAQTNASGGSTGNGLNLGAGAIPGVGILAAGNALNGNGGTEVRRWPAVAANTLIRVGTGDFLTEFAGVANNNNVGIEAVTVNIPITATFLWAEVIGFGYF